MNMNSVKSLTVQLSSDAQTANYSYETYTTPIWYGGTEITYLDRTSNVAINSVTYQGQPGERLYQVQAVDYNANLYNSRVSYELTWTPSGTGWAKPTLRQHMAAIADAMGLDLIWIVHDNFQVPCNEPLIVTNGGTGRKEKHEGTVSELIDRLVGWSRDIPNMEYTVRIWGNALNVIQRGGERQTVDLSTGKIARNPSVSVHKIFTLWNSRGTNYIYSSDNSLTKQAFTGTISFGTRRLTYSDGYLQSETVIGGASTTYTYRDEQSVVGGTATTENAKYLSSKTVVDDETKTETHYEYYTTANEVYMGKETEYKYSVIETEGSSSSSSLELESVTVTEHVPIGNGWYGTTTYDQTDGGNEIINTSLGQGAPGGKVSQYMVDAQQEGLTNNSGLSERRAYVAGVPRVASTYPVYDISTLNEIARNINGLNGCYEYTANVDVYGINTCIDTDTIVVFDGENWHVQSNSIEITPFHKLQRLTLIRWE